jgi:predicted HTH transcriptional regulator
MGGSKALVLRDGARKRTIQTIQKKVHMRRLGALISAKYAEIILNMRRLMTLFSAYFAENEQIHPFIKGLAGSRSITLSEENLQGVTQRAKFWESHRGAALNERQRKMLNKLMDGFEGKLTSSKWAKMTKCSPDTALRDIQDLIEKEILEKEEGGGRSTSYRIKN